MVPRRTHTVPATRNGDEAMAPAPPSPAGGLWAPLALNVVPAADASEREANAIADRVMSGDGSGAPPGPIRSSSTGRGNLDASTRGFFEPRFGRDLSDVSVHTGS